MLLAGWGVRALVAANPGNLPRLLPDGTARLLRKGERLVLETHYHKTGRVEKDGWGRISSESTTSISSSTTSLA